MTSNFNPGQPLDRPRPPAPGAPGIGRQPFGQNPYDLGSQFAQHYGGMATHQIVTGMANGQPPQPVGAVGPAAAPGPDSSTNVAGPTSTPQDAGTLNSIDPGHFTGHSANGYPKADEGVPDHAAALRHPMPKPPGAGPVQPVSPMPNPPAPPPPVPPQPAPPVVTPPADALPPVTPPGPLPVQPTGDRASAGMGIDEGGQHANEQAIAGSGSDGGGAAKTKGGAADLKGVAADLGTQFGADSGQSAMVTSQQDRGAAGSSGGGSVAPPPLLHSPTNGVSTPLDPPSVTREPDAPPPAPPAASPATPTAATPPGSSGGQTVQPPPLDVTNGGTQDPPTNYAAYATQGQETLNKYTDLTGLKLPTTNPVTGGHAALAPNASAADILAAVGNDPGLDRIALEAQKLTNKLSSTAPDGTPASLTATESARLADLQGIIGHYGVTFNAAGTGPNGETLDPNAQVATGGSTYASMVAYFNSKGWGDKSPMMAEQAIAQQQQDLKNQNTQTAATGVSGAISKFDESPLYTGSQHLAAEGLANPDATDWEKVKNKAVATSDATFKTANDQLSADLARRGLGAIGGAGAAGELQRGHANDVASMLGSLDIEESEKKRKAERDAISTALATMGATTGQDVSYANELGNVVTGGNVNDQNYASGAAAAIANINAMQASADAANKQGQFGWADAAKLVGGLVGTVLGGPAGGAIASTVLGGAAKAAGG